MNRFAARQAIFDNDNNVFAYELLYRNSLINICPDVDADTATIELIKTTMESCQSKTFTNKKPAFINFTLETLQKGYPFQFDKEHIIVELLETEQPSPELLSVCINLYNKGYYIALDDFIHHQQWHDFFPYIKIIKVDFQQTGCEEIIELIEHLNDYPNVQLLAEKIENQQQYRLAKSLDFEFFQGYYFERPEIITSKPSLLKNFDFLPLQPAITF